MPLKLDCPRCKQSLAVPTKLAGSYVNCPRCKGRLWVPDAAEGGTERGDSFPSVTPLTPGDKAGEGPPSADGRLAPATARSEVASAGSSASSAERNGAGTSWAPPLTTRSPLTSMRAFASAAPLSTAAPASPTEPAAPVAKPAAPPAARPAAGRSVAAPTPVAAAAAPMAVSKKTARLISAAAAPSTLHLTPDGKLPELRLDDGARTVESDAKHKAVSPLVLFAVLCLSAAFSMVAVMVDFEGPDLVRLRQKSEARQKIEMNYFPMVAEQGRARPAEPYQRYLGEAARAYARGDRLTERRMYNKVLDLLRAERDRFQRGLTGSRERDKELEQQIIVLLGDD